MKFIYFCLLFSISSLSSINCFGLDYKKWWDERYKKGETSGRSLTDDN